MKEAKSEAESIIAAYRAEMEAGYQKKFNMVSTASIIALCLILEAALLTRQRFDITTKE
jgi:hypothetical protein